MKNPVLYKEIVGEDMPPNTPSQIEHDTTNYVDDSSNSIGGNSIEEIKSYTGTYMSLIGKYYDANRLKLNQDKTTVMVVDNPEKKGIRLTLELGEDKVKSDLSIKILGWWITPDNKLNHYISKIKGPIYRTLAEIKPYLQFMNLKQRREVIYSKALSIVNYGLALYTGQTEEIKDKMTALMMKGNRMIYNKPVLEGMKKEWICKQIQVKTPRQMMAEAAAKEMHRIVNTQAPPELYKLLVFPTHFRKAAKIALNHYPRTKKCHRSLFYKSLQQFNSLPEDLKYCHPKMFKRLIKKRRIC